MPNTLTIRPAAATDEEAVVALWRVCGLTVPYNDPAGDFHFARGKDSSDILVGIDETGVLRGTIMVGHDGHRGWVYYVAVHPDCRQQDIGRRLMESAEGWLSERGVPKVMLMVRPTNTAVVEFYKRIGYQTAQRVLMEKWLDGKGPKS